MASSTVAKRHGAVDNLYIQPVHCIPVYRLKRSETSDYRGNFQINRCGPPLAMKFSAKLSEIVFYDARRVSRPNGCVVADACSDGSGVHGAVHSFPDWDLRGKGPLANRPGFGGQRHP